MMQQNVPSLKPDFRSEDIPPDTQPDKYRPGRILAVLLSVVLVVAILAVVVSQFVYFTAQETRYSTTDQITYPDLEQLELQAAEMLGQYAVLDRETGVYRIPIDRAIELIANEEARSE